MFLELEPVFNVDGAEKTFDYSFSAEDDGFTTPVSVKGKVKNSTGIVKLDAEAVFTYSTQCARCAKPLKFEKSVSIEHLLIAQLNDEDNDLFILVEDMHLNLDELVYEDIVLSMPLRYLCSDNCKGLCPFCGCDLNVSGCDCKPPEDPRWEVLKQLLDN